MKKLNGKVAVVTGSDRGIGKGIAVALAREGCKVVVNSYRESEEAKKAVDEIKKLVDKAVEKFGRLDIMVNNAGILVGGTVETLTEQDWDKQMDVNLKGVFFGTKYAVLRMKKQGYGGRIINISSIAGLVGL